MFQNNHQPFPNTMRQMDGSVDAEQRRNARGAHVRSMAVTIAACSSNDAPRAAGERGMRVRYSRFVGVACIIAALVFGVLAILSGNVSFVGAMAPVAFLGFGIAILTRPYVIFDEHVLIVKALIGPAQETYDLGAAGTGEFDGTRVFLINASGRRRLRGVTGWLANRHDWAALRAWAEGRRGGHTERGV